MINLSLFSDSVGIMWICLISKCYNIFYDICSPYVIFY